jgi:transcriptional regulator NrdR family protein
VRCRYCGAPTRVLSTRQPTGEFYVVRRLTCTAVKEHRFNTVEVLETLIRKFARTHIEKLLSYNRRGAERLRLAHQRRQAVADGIKAGVKYEAIAADLGVSLATVRKHAAALRDGKPGKIGRPVVKSKPGALTDG